MFKFFFFLVFVPASSFLAVSSVVLDFVNLSDFRRTEKVLGETILGGESLVSLNYFIDPQTKTQFNKKVIQTRKAITFITQEVKDDNLERGKREVRQTGKDGLLTQDFEVTFWGNEEFNRILLKETKQEPVNQIEAIGTKIIIRDLTIGDDIFHYSDKYRMFATSYDGNCQGCGGKTFSGTKVIKGVCAVDPKVIPLGSWLYVEGYGTCKAEDIGAAVKGLKIDLGFEDTSLGDWKARFTTVYLLIPK